MKRSEINKIIESIINDTENYKLPLPFFAYYTFEDWKIDQHEKSEIFANMLGWDVTDFGEKNYYSRGLASFVFRNGNAKKPKTFPKPYCEKLLIVEDGQELPFHFHWKKMEDIINRGGGVLEITLYNSTKDEKLDVHSDVDVTMDGIHKVLPAGSKVHLYPGDSITLKPYIYHKWVGLPNTGRVLLFEISTTNNDETDNRFLEGLPRLINIENDQSIKYLTINDYSSLDGDD